MSRALHKVTKQISKKRGNKLNTLHENSRDSKRLRRAGMREEKVAKTLHAARTANQLYGMFVADALDRLVSNAFHFIVNRVEWFRNMIDEPEEDSLEKILSDEDVQVLTSEFVNRLDEDIQDLKSQRRPGRPPSSTEDQLKNQKEADEKEFKGGLWVPEVRSHDAREKLRKWNGEWSGLNTLKFVRVVKDGAIRDSSFPPKGMS